MTDPPFMAGSVAGAYEAGWKTHMAHRFPLLFAGLGLPLLALVLAAAPAGAQERCYGDWADAAPIVAGQRLRSARDAQDVARDRLSGDVVRIVLCETPAGFVYRIVMRREDGRIANLTVNATASAK